MAPDKVVGGKVAVYFRGSPNAWAGSTEIIDDPAEKKRVWDVIDYDLSAFWPGGPEDPEYSPVRITPVRIELSKMFGTQDKRVWRSS